MHKQVKTCLNKIEKIICFRKNNFLYLWKKDNLREQVFIQNWRMDKFLQLIDIQKQVKTCLNKIEKKFFCFRKHKIIFLFVEKRQTA